MSVKNFLHDSLVQPKWLYWYRWELICFFKLFIILMFVKVLINIFVQPYADNGGMFQLNFRIFPILFSLDSLQFFIHILLQINFLFLYEQFKAYGQLNSKIHSNQNSSHYFWWINLQNLLKDHFKIFWNNLSILFLISSTWTAFSLVWVISDVLNYLNFIILLARVSYFFVRSEKAICN